MRLKFLQLLMIAATCSAQSDTLSYEVWEERHPGTLVGNLTKDTTLEERWKVEEIQEMTFRTITQQSSRFAEYFTVDESLGVIRTNRIIDRDRLCSQSPTCDVVLTIRIDPIKYFEIFKVKIKINDRNDNPPTFSSQQIDRSIQESASIGARITIPNAEDLDSEDNGIKSYELQPADSPFTLDTSDFQNADSLSLVLQRRLDRETEDFYSLTVVAHDGGITPLSGSMVIRITVLDSNDNNPTFSNQTYETSLYEDASPSTTIVRVHATDPDDGLNGDVVYSLEPTTEAEFGHIFGIGNISGNIFLKQGLNYEDTTTYTLNVLAKDRGPNSLPAYTRVIVNVLDINDNAPVIQVNTLNENGIATVAEGSSIGLFVAHLSVKDEDTTSNEVNCSLDSVHFGLSQLFLTEYKIVTKTVFDREVQSEYHVNLVCQDSGNPPRTTTKYIPIIITDVNDNAPTFYQSTYNVTVSENSPIGTSLIRFNASDKDIGENAAILYKVRDDDLRWVNIDLVSGVVVTSDVFDYETQDTIEVVVTAKDQGTPEQTTSTTLVIKVLDVIDDTPEFQKDLFTFAIKENVDPMTKVGVVPAKYKNDGVKYDIVYNLVALKAVPFMIRNATIFTTASLDRENQSSYQFQISANNIGDANLISRTNVTINIVDVNDNTPLVTYPNVSNNYMKISSKTTKNSVLLKINASDADEGINQELTYRISDSSCRKDIFGVDDATGVMYLASALNMTSKSVTCEVHVKVEDKGSPKKATMVIMIFYVADEVPLVPGLSYGTTTEMVTTNATGIVVASQQDQPFWKTSTMFGVGVAIAVFVITLVVIIAVVIIKHRRKAAADSRRYNCRLQAEKVLKTPTPPEKNGTAVVGNDVIYGGYGSNDTTMTLDIDIGESNTDDLSEWNGNVNPDIIRVTKGRGLSPKPSPNTSSSSSRIQDSGLDLSWQDTSGNPQVWTVPIKDHPKTPVPSTGIREKLSVGSPLTDVELQVQDMLHMLEKDRTSDTGSFTDSGKGPSEEGDQHGHLPPLEPHYTAVKRASKSDIPLVAEAHQMALKVMDDYCRPAASRLGKTHPKEPLRDPRDPMRDPLRDPFRFPHISSHPQNRGNVRRHHSDNLPLRSDKDENRRRSYSHDVHARDPALYDIYDIPLQSSPTSADNDSALEDHYRSHGTFKQAPNTAPLKGRLPPGYLTSRNTDPNSTGSEYELNTLSDNSQNLSHPKHTTSGVLLRSPKRDKYHPSSKLTQAPQIRSKSRPSYTVGPVEVCVKDVISQYIPKKANSRDDDSGDALSDGTTTSGSYTVSSEVPAKKDSWGSDSVIV